MKGKLEKQARDDILPDVLAAGLDVVFCGSAAGTRSAQAGAYYAGPGNRFWPTLFSIGLIPERIRPADFRQVIRYGIGLTDLAKKASGSDASLSKSDYDSLSLRMKITASTPRLLAFNGKRAASLFLRRPVQYGLQAESIESTALCVLPSTSGAARRFWCDEPWLALVKWLRR